MSRTNRLVLLLALGLATAFAATARAADTTIAADPAAQAVTALGGTIVWVTGGFGAQSLVQHDASGTRPVPGAPRAAAYRSVDLGRDRAGRLVLTYQRCSKGMRCAALRDDLQGHRASMRALAPSGCALTTAPAVWRTWSAYGLECRVPGTTTFDARRSGLYVRADGRPARRLARPEDAVRFGSDLITLVDLRGTRVAAVAADVYAYAFSQTVDGTSLRSAFVAASEGDGDERAVALALGTTSTLWSLTDGSHAGDPNYATIARAASGCVATEALANPSESDEGYRATGLAADGSALYLVVPGTGIVRHDFAPARAC